MPLRIAILDRDATQLAALAGALSAYRCQSFHSPAALLHALHASNALQAPDSPRPESGAAETAGNSSIGFDLFLLDLHTLQNHAETAAILAAARTAAIPMLLCAGRADAAALGNVLASGLASVSNPVSPANAVDYIFKPLRLSEMLLRVQILLKRAYPQYRDQQQIRFGVYVFETPSNRVVRNGNDNGNAKVGGNDIDVIMTQKEFELALLLFGNLGRPLSRAYIQEAIWSRDSDLPSRTMDTHISRVRNKLQLKPEHGFRLTPVYGYGYQLEQMAGPA